MSGYTNALYSKDIPQGLNLEELTMIRETWIAEAKRLDLGQRLWDIAATLGARDSKIPRLMGLFTYVSIKMTIRVFAGMERETKNVPVGWVARYSVRVEVLRPKDLEGTTVYAHMWKYIVNDKGERISGTLVHDGALVEDLENEIITIVMGQWIDMILPYTEKVKAVRAKALAEAEAEKRANLAVSMQVGVDL